VNKRYILFNLREAAEELQRIIREIETDSAYFEFNEVGSFDINMRHLYYHLNTAWNAKKISDEEEKNARDSDFHKWAQYPTDLEIF
jgi:hypothetical protein